MTITHRRKKNNERTTTNCRKRGCSASWDRKVLNQTLFFVAKLVLKSPACGNLRTVSGHCKDRPVRTNKLLTMENNDNKSISTSGQGATPFAQTYFHGTKADLKVGDLIEVGFNSNYGQQKNVKYIFLTGTLDAAIWGAELAFGDGRERIYLVEPTGEIENDPDLTDKKFPGNPTQSYRSTKPFRVIGEVTVWQGHPAEQVKTMKEHLKKLKEQGINSLNDE